jgi:hypothetical protein
MGAIPALSARLAAMPSRKSLGGFVVLAVFLLYLIHVFQVFDARFWHAGLSYWLDPYFINVLLEHWYVSLRDGADPSSPPMFFPARKTLGYSHGLVLYVPFYVPLRLFLHPFLAYNWTLLLVFAVGIACLYALFRKLGLSLVEALVVTALFFTSRNVINEPTNAWTQRASVFLIPPILLMLLASARMPAGRSKVVLAGLTGLLATLMYVQDFYTAHFALLFAAAFAAAAVVADGLATRVSATTLRAWRAQTRASQLALIAAAIATAWAWYLWMFGGGEIRLLGIRLRSHQWERPAAIAAGASLAWLWLNRQRFVLPRLARPSPWPVAAIVGAAAGALVFLWIYAPAYLEHRAVPDEHLLNQMIAVDPSAWNGPRDALRDLEVYDSWRSFALVLIVAVLVWVPQAGTGRKARIYWMWLLGVSVAVLLVPLRFPRFSLWRTFVEPLPGFGVIRDPKRVIHLYELTVALATAAFLARLDAKSASRAAVTLLVVCLIVTDPGPGPFRYRRSIAVYERWVAAPIAIDPSCRSFYIQRASASYMSRSDNMWPQYSIDALFIALQHGIPTLNGYSAWVPPGWTMLYPTDADYEEAVARWIDQHQLTDVCVLDIDARTMRPR